MKRFNRVYFNAPLKSLKKVEKLQQFKKFNCQWKNLIKLVFTHHWKSDKKVKKLTMKKKNSLLMENFNWVYVNTILKKTHTKNVLLKPPKKREKSQQSDADFNEKI